MVDLCDDDEAINLGLDGGDLDGDRRRAGIDCTSPQGKRFASIQEDDTLAIHSGDRFQELPDVSPPGLDLDAPSMAELASVVGRTYANTGNFPDQYRGKRLLEIDASTINVVDDQTFGMVYNGTDQVARNVRVAAGAAVYELPLSMQPLEQAPFVLPGKVDIEAINVDARLSANVDLSRLLTPSLNGRTFRQADTDYAALGVPGVTDDLDASLRVEFWNLTIAVPDKVDLEAQARVMEIIDPVALVGVYDDSMLLVDLFEAPVMTLKPVEYGYMELDAPVSVGSAAEAIVVVPIDNQYDIWSGGRGQ